MTMLATFIVIFLAIGFVAVTEISAIFIYPVYKKAGVPQKWFVFIPVISFLPMFNVAKMSRWWFLLLAGLEAATFASEASRMKSAFAGAQPDLHMPVLYYAFATLSFAFGFYITRRIFKAFGVPNWVTWVLVMLLISDLFSSLNAITSIVLSIVSLACAIILLVYWCRMAWGKFQYDASRIS